MKNFNLIVKSLITTLCILIGSAAFAGGGGYVAPASANFFDSWFVGPQIGLARSSFNNANITSTTINGVAGTGTQTISGTSPFQYAAVAGLQGGYGKMLSPNFYLGFIAFATWGNQSATNALMNGGPNGGSTFQMTSVNYRLKNLYGCGIKPGWLLSPETLLYAELGVAASNLSVSETAFDNTNTLVGTSAANFQNFSKNMAGFEFGAGIEQAVTKKLAAHAMMRFVNYGSISGTVRGPANANGDFIQTTVAARPFTISWLAGIDYYFNNI